MNFTCKWDTGLSKKKIDNHYISPFIEYLLYVQVHALQATGRWFSLASHEDIGEAAEVFQKCLQMAASSSVKIRNSLLQLSKPFTQMETLRAVWPVDKKDTESSARQTTSRVEVRPLQVVSAIFNCIWYRAKSISTNSWSYDEPTSRDCTVLAMATAMVFCLINTVISNMSCKHVVNCFGALFNVQRLKFLTFLVFYAKAELAQVESWSKFLWWSFKMKCLLYIMQQTSNCGIKKMVLTWQTVDWIEKKLHTWEQTRKWELRSKIQENCTTASFQAPLFSLFTACWPHENLQHKSSNSVSPVRCLIHVCYMQVLRELSLQEQSEAVLISILQTITEYGRHMTGEKAELLVLCVLLGRIDDLNLAVRSVAAQLLIGTYDSDSNSSFLLHPWLKSLYWFQFQIPSILICNISASSLMHVE